MFVLATNYNKLKNKLEKLAEELRSVRSKYLDSLFENYKLSEKIAYLQKNNTETILQFTQQELRTLLTLTHPDKHQGKKVANDITAKILKLLGK